jgi:hypothetical protein
MKQETLEEVLGSSMCEFSVIENKLAILYRNQVKIYDAITNQQAKRMYSEEEVYNLLCSMPNFFNMTIPQQIKARNKWFEQFKKK